MKSDFVFCTFCAGDDEAPRVLFVQFTRPQDDEALAIELAERKTTDIWAQVDAECARFVLDSHDDKVSELEV